MWPCPELSTSSPETAYNPTMKILRVFTPFSFLALCCCFLGATTEGPDEDECSKFEPPKGQPFVCTDDYTPVCCTDNETYPNKCMLCKAKRETGKDIGVKHHGKCGIKDECSKFPKPMFCTKEYHPVCGTDGSTYGNLCMLCLARKETGKDIEVKYKGECKKKDECSEFPEPPKGHTFLCPAIYKPVCGSDGVTYGNKCIFCDAKWQSGGKIRIKHKGPCKEKDECAQYPEPVKGQEVVCTLEYMPLCASNGVTYSNKCFFCNAKRQSGGKIRIKHKGPCKEKDECAQYPEPVKGQEVACTREYMPLCASNGVTYSNKCIFCNAKRQSGGKIRITHKGPCKEKDECGQYPEPVKGQEVACTLEYMPLCGSNGETYGNKCIFCNAKRKSGGKITLKHKGPCEQKNK